MLPGWVLSLLAGTLLLPVLVASVDAFARARRRHVDVLRWMRWIGAWVAPVPRGARAGAVPRAGRRHAVTAARAGAAGRPAARRAGARRCSPAWPSAWASPFFLARWLAVRPDRELEETPDLGAGVALGLTIAAGSLLLWLVNPFAGLLVGAGGAPVDAARAHPAAAGPARPHRC